MITLVFSVTDHLVSFFKAKELFCELFESERMGSYANFVSFFKALFVLVRMVIF